MNSYSINQYRNYHIGNFDGINFSKFYSGNESWLREPESIVKYISTNLPEDIDTIVNFGCASGRDFIPFSDINCVGFDIAPVNVINWVCDTTNLTYFQCSIEDFIDNKNLFDLHIDWNTSLVYTSGALMYVDHTTQNKFIDVLFSLNCKNMIFQEYVKIINNKHNFLKLNENYDNIFRKQLFRPTEYNQPICHIYLESGEKDVQV
jgi:hypothetical protein